MAWSKSLLAALVVAVLAASPAAAQRTGTRLDRNAGSPNNITDTSVKSAILVANGFGQCLARREGVAIAKALEFPLLSAEQSKAVDRRMEAFDECLGDSPEFNQLRSGLLPIVGGISEWFFNTQLKRTDLSALGGMNDDALMLTEFRPRTELEDFGLCVIRRDVAKSVALLEAKPTTNAEAQAIKAITPELGPCISAGTNITLNASNIRSVISFALYRASSKLAAAK